MPPEKSIPNEYFNQMLLLGSQVAAQSNMIAILTERLENVTARLEAFEKRQEGGIDKLDGRVVKLETFKDTMSGKIDGVSRTTAIFSGLVGSVLTIVVTAIWKGLK